MAETDLNLAPDVAVGSLHEPNKGTSAHPLIELRLARIREFVRQPEAVFWMFGFPLPMAFALGIAFREKAPERLPIAVESDSVNATQTAEAISSSQDLRAIVMSPAETAQALRTGRVALVVKTTSAANAVAGGSAPGFEYRF